MGRHGPSIGKLETGEGGAVSCRCDGGSGDDPCCTASLFFDSRRKGVGPQLRRAVTARGTASKPVAVLSVHDERSWVGSTSGRAPVSKTGGRRVQGPTGLPKKQSQRVLWAIRLLGDV